ncbi:MAG: DUF4397 domain-containing protein [Longimicrobiales bacterium]|nr:DUF4397 domain-containing protein [Longimicrobiales bacterium]
MNIPRSIWMLLCVAALSSGCDKNAVQDITGPLPGGARIKFFNFGVSSPGVNFYANDTKMTAITSATGIESTSGVAYGSAGSGGLYMAIAAGQYTLKGKIAAATDKDLAVSNLPVTLADGKFYSFYQSGIYNTTSKTVDAFMVEDPLPAQFDFTTAYVRFVNAIYNANAMTLYAKNTTTLAEAAVGGSVAYKAAGAFVAVPNGTYDLGARYAGVTTNALSRTGVSFSAGRVYTITARGDITVATTQLLDNTTNR